MEELALHILDITQNSIRAGARNVKVTVEEDAAANKITVVISDDGSGMDEDMVKKLSDPFFTTRDTRNVGLGIPLFVQTAEACAGKVEIDSEPGLGTTVKAEFQSDHVDRPPLGDMAATVWALITLNPKVEFEYRHSKDGDEFVVNTAEIKDFLRRRKLSSPRMAKYLKEYLADGEARLAGGHKG
jgi:anti-sigma regulatory factor (Ser/Thr protein kinase)